MANDGGDKGPGPVAAAFSVLVLLFFAVSALAPLADFATYSPTDFSLGDAVATRGDAAPSRLQNYRSAYDALGPAKVQEKLRNLPAFYVSADADGAGPAMGDGIYLSCAEAEAAAAKSSDAAAAVRATTLDQVLYPLVLGREAPKATVAPPAEVAAALRARERGAGPPRSYALVPSAAALRDYAAPDAAPLRPGDAPLFVVDRLAFAGADGRPTVPLFTERGEGLASYARLRDSGGGTLPAEPTVRTTTLRDVLESMEGGTRPAVGQLAFYGNAEDALRAEALASR